MSCVEIITTSDRKAVLRRIGTALVRKRLAACVQVFGGIDSMYRWNGRVEHTREWVCVVKTKKSAFKAVEREIMSNHNYRLPQITMMDISGGSKGYLDWIAGEVA
jgi:periplasmic divalent cation tolerance protein